MHLGIDLGTSNSAVVGHLDGQLRLFKSSEGTDVLPSAIYIDRRGHKLFGRRAYEQTLLSPNNVAQRFKRLMGTSDQMRFEAAGLVMSPEEASAEILRQLVGQAMTEAGEQAIEGCVVTIPAAFNQMQSEATIRAARAAGLDPVGLLQEPIAAAMAAMVGAKEQSGTFLVYDLGGGTLDLALVQSVAGTVSILGHAGINMLGGSDFDRLIVDAVVRPWLAEHFDIPADFQSRPEGKRLFQIARWYAEKAKIDLSMITKATILGPDEEVRVKDASGRDIWLEVELTRDRLDALVAPRIAESLELTRSLLTEHGYDADSIDRIVLIGGPTKMPVVRRMVEERLAIRVDLATDPMTAVASGAAIFAESREWLTGEKSHRKASRGSTTSGTAVKLRFDWPTRTTESVVRLRARPEGVEATLCELEVTNGEGWTSGRKQVGGGIDVDVPVPVLGLNRVSARVFDEAGKPLPEASARLEVTRTHSSAAGIPATQTIAVKVVEGDGERARNVLQPLVLKGALLPVQGTTPFLAARDLRAGEPGSIDLELFQQEEGVPEPEKNLFVGCFQIAGTDLPQGLHIRRGDPIVCHWNMDDSGLLGCGLELPKQRQAFESRKFYSDTAGHRSFEGEEGRGLATTLLDDAETELLSTDDALGEQAQPLLAKLRLRTKRAREALEQAVEPDSLRSVAEEARRISQDLSKVRHAPEHREAVLLEDLRELEQNWRTQVAPHAEPVVSTRFRQLVDQARDFAAIAGGADRHAVEEAERLLDAARSLYYRELFQQPEYLAGLLDHLAQSRHLAQDRAAHDAAIAAGRRAAAARDLSGLQRAVGALLDNQIVVGGAKGPITELAGLMRG